MNYNLKDNLNAMLFFTFIFAVCLTFGALYPSSAQATGSIISCSDCHGNAPLDGTARNVPSGQFPGSHNTHAGVWYTTTDSRYNIPCEVCHYSPNYTWYSHQGDSIQVNLRWLSMAGNVMQPGSVAGWGSYSKWTSFNLTNNPTMGNCANTYCHSNGTGGTANTATDPRPVLANISPMWGTNPQSTPICFPCHGKETGNPKTGAPWYTSSPTTATAGVKANSHQLHAWQTAGSPMGPVPATVTGGAPCWKCHYATSNSGANVITSIGNHIKRTYSVTPVGGIAGWGTISYTYAYSTTGGTCSATTCHSSNGGNPGQFMKWGSGNLATPNGQCVKCHGIVGKTVQQWTTDNNVAAPGYSTIGVSTWGSIGTITNGVSNAPKVWAHNSHLNSRSVKGYTTVRGVECSDCHDMDGIKANIWASNHMNGKTEFSWSSLARNEGNNNPHWNTLVLSPWYSSGNQGCGNIYCHGQSITVASVWGTAWSSLRFNNNQWLTVASAKNSRSCNSCHQAPPTRTTFFNHTGKTLADSCASCHGHEGNGANHINGILDATVGCMSCHVDVQGSRRSMGGEISTIRTHGHMKTAGRPFNAFDCGVCHMEGNPKTGLPVSPYHSATVGNGTLEFRNPDTGNPIEWATFNSGGGGSAPWTTGGYWMTNIGAGWATSSFFIRNTGDRNLEAFAKSVQVNLCLRCHDANGASNSAAWSTFGGTGTAPKPWGSGTGVTIDTSTEFWSTATYHPVMRRQNNSYADKDTMDRWNSFDKGAASNTKFGDLITCWDCHDATSAWRTVGGGVSANAHGYTTIVRADYAPTGAAPTAGVATPLCVVCHKSSVYWAATVHSVNGATAGLSGWHTSPSVGSYKNTSEPEMTGCTACHGYDNFSAIVTRPAGPNVHGANSSGRAGIPTPYSFIRSGGTPVWSAGSCDMTGGCRSASGTYTPGGTY